MRVLAVSDSDSYLKWSLATLRRLPSDWRTSQVVIDSPLRPTAAQVQSAAPVLSRAGVLSRIRKERPDVVLLGCTGPVVAALTDARELRERGRPVLLTGLPGISYPVRPRAITHRTGCDLMLLHSHREVAAFTTAGAEVGSTLQYALATLPFLGEQSERAKAQTTLFAAQAEIPPARTDREAILLALADCPRPVVKLRAAEGEQQTHRETWSYRRLATELGLGRIDFRTGPIAAALPEAAGLVTVSSTAALEAIAADVPILILTDFGLDDTLINTVFEGSGCLGTLADLRAGRFTRPDHGWRTQNYFHPTTDADWQQRLVSLISQRRADGLPLPARHRSSLGAVVRRRIRLLAPARFAARRLSDPPTPGHTAPVRPPDRRPE